MIALLRDLARDESGTALVEFALIFTFVSVAAYGALMVLGTTLENLYNSNSASLAGLATAPP